MYSNQSFDEKVTTRKHKDDYDLCNTEVGHKLIVQWSPQNGARYLSKNHCASPRSLSKSVPRRHRGIVRYNINKSLNFDIGMRSRADSFKSPNSSPDSNLSADNDNYLSRSAKILRALNINYSPLKSTGLGTHKIIKSLNFDPSLSSKSFVNLNKSMHNSRIKSLVSPLPKINKTLNYETSSGESSIDSRLDSSVESIDENQNQTPSQRNRRAKKSLNYPSPKFESKNLTSPDTSAYSPMLRSDLREKIDDIIQSSMMPNLQSSKRYSIKNKLADFGASTPRNLLNDFHDDEDEDMVVEARDNVRSQTPENFIKMIPESMSAIKKTHRKERVLGRLGKAMAYQAETCSGSESFVNIAMDMELEGNRTTTPFVTSGRYNSPHCGVNSIKQSHKKDVSKIKSYVENSEEEMSETGSIFDYTNEENAITKDSSKIDKNEQGADILERRDSHEFKEENDQENSRLCDKVSSHVETAIFVEDSTRGVISSPEVSRDMDKLKVVQEASTSVGDPLTAQTDVSSVMRTPGKSTGNSLRPGTPESRIYFLQRIMTDSIKKSHKKIKDTNKKLQFKEKTIQADTKKDTNIISSVNEDNAITVEDDRAATPENMNSSRLLLSQFSSVKKSHRKGKHRKMLSGSLQRKKFFDNDGKGASYSDSVSSSVSDFSSLSPSQISSNSAKPPSVPFGQCKKDNLNELSSSDNSSDVHYHSLERYPLDSDTCEMGIGTLLNSDFRRTSPNKRKNLSNDSLTCAISQSPTNQGSISYESTEEEFKIFTPIKKRKSLSLVAPIARRICDSKSGVSPESGELSDGALVGNATTRCSTPTTARGGCLKLIENSFKTANRNPSGIFVSITDYSTPVLPETENASGDSNGGRATPHNRSTAVLMCGINSIKKSHKKDKRANLSRRFLICTQEKEYESEFTSSLENDSSKSLQLRDNPQPSTSYEIANECAIIELDNKMDELAKTPPNCLEAKNYLRLRQTESIKRSHKKVRERKKYRSIVVDSELSDDGSIFDQVERSNNVQNEGSRELGNEKSNSTVQAYALRKSSPKKYFVSTSFENKDQHFHDAAPYCFRGNQSNDGSIFELGTKLETPCKNLNCVERENTIQF